MSFRLVYLNTASGELGKLPDFGIVNIGGTAGPTFTVDGKALLFADGGTTDGSPASLSLTLQGAYNNSAAPATINLTAGRDLVFNALNSKAFQFDAATGKVTITGDLEVLGASSIIEGTISNVDQLAINAPSGSTSSLLIQPMAGVVMTTDVVRIQNQSGALPVFTIDALGNTFIRTLSVGSVDFAAFYNAFTSHIALGGIKHEANQISVAPLTYLAGADVQAVLEEIDLFIASAGSGSVTSVAVTSADMVVTGSPITSTGTIDLELNTVPIAKGGTGEITASAAINALVPLQAGQGGKVLSTDGTAVAWVALGASSSGAGLFFTNAAPTSSGNVGGKLYVSGTTPANKVIYEATTDNNAVTVTLFAEGDSAFYSPTITITTIPPQAGGPIVAAITEDPADKRSYTAVAPLVGLTVSTVVNAVSSTGATATMTIQRAAVGPTFSALAFGPLPGLQTEVKAGDVITVSGTVQNDAVYAEIVSGGAVSTVTAMTLGAPGSGGIGFRSAFATVTIGGGTGPQTVQARARTSLGTYGANFTTTNNVVLNQTYPSIVARVITYPAGQQAIKGIESATVTAAITNFDTVQYSGTDLSVFSPTTYSAAKVVTRTGGTYSFNVPNYTIAANKASNNATTTVTSAITIADVPPTAAITISGSPARLFSSPTGVDYTITITANQRLSVAPSLVASSGTWQGGWSGSGSTWTRVLRIVDANPKGPQLFSGMSLTGLAGLVGSVITSGAAYIVGGFAARIITFAPFERFHAIGTNVVDFTKVTASYTGSSVLTRRSDTNDVFQNFTIVNASGVFDPTGGFLFISDLAFSGANTSGTLQLTVAEAA